MEDKMLKAITDIVGSKLVDLEGSQTIGQVVGWVVNSQEKKISALLIKLPGLLRKLMVVTTIDIIEYGPGIVVVRNQNAVVSSNEVVGLQKLIKSKHRIIDSRVETKSGKVLGLVENLLFETTDSTIQKLYVKPRLLEALNKPDLIISADRIIEIGSNKVIVDDDVANIRVEKTAQVDTRAI